MNSKEIQELLVAVLTIKASSCKIEPPYAENKYTYGEYLEGLNEGYQAGLREAIRTIKASDFLINS